MSTAFEGKLHLCHKVAVYLYGHSAVRKQSFNNRNYARRTDIGDGNMNFSWAR